MYLCVVDGSALNKKQCLHVFSSVKKPGRPKHPCLYKPVWGPGESELSQGNRDPLLDSLSARETNHPQDPGCFRASFTTRIICLHSASWVCSTSWVCRPRVFQQTPFCPLTVCCYEDGVCEPKEVDPAEASQLDEAADMEVGSCEEEWRPLDRIHLEMWIGIASPNHYLDTSL